MSIDTAIANLDRKEFFCPLDMGLHSDTRAIENIPSLFHLAAVRLVRPDRLWYGQRIVLIDDTATDPSWDDVMSRCDGWKNILPHVLGNLMLERSFAGTQLQSESIRNLMVLLQEHIEDLKEELRKAKETVEIGEAEHAHLFGALQTELSEAWAKEEALACHLKGQY